VPFEVKNRSKWDNQVSLGDKGGTKAQKSLIKSREFGYLFAADSMDLFAVIHVCSVGSEKLAVW